MIWIAILAAVLVFGLVYYFAYGGRSNAVARVGLPKPAEGVGKRSRYVPHQFWGQQLVVPDPDQACRRARALNGSYFENGKVPHLPLPECDSPRCTCWFRVAGDNRADEDRRLDMDRREQPRINVRADRRTGRDRRAADGQQEDTTQ